MTPWGVLIISWAYLLGLLATGITENTLIGVISTAGFAVFVLSGIVGLVLPRMWKIGPTSKQWWIAGLVGMIAASYCIARSPQPATDDVSRFVSEQEQRVLGMVMEMPQTTRQNKGKFFLQAQSVRGVGDSSLTEIPKSVSGKLYVTAALSPSKKLYPGQMVELKGKIYPIKRGSEAEKSSFGDYLAKQGCFAGFRTRWIDFLPGQAPPHWALWKLRERIVLAQDRWLGEPAGNLLSAMTLGRRAVDLPYEVKDEFIKAGLAHTLAASGFHVSLILGIVLKAVKFSRPRTQAIAGLTALVIYIGLTGLQPSVVRASVMGAGALLGLALQRQIKPLGCLLVAANLILLCNPQWVWDVGFQLSAMATLGLILSVPWLMARMEWLPTTVSTLLAVPIAAYFWTIPLQLHYFEVLPSYSILLNGIATPLVVVISVGGFVSAGAAILLPIAGSFIAANLYYPIHVLIWLVSLFNQLPGSSVEIEGFGAWHVIVAYGVYASISIWLWKREKRKTFALAA